MIQKVPIPLCGVMLGFAALGNLLQSYGEGIRYVCGGIATFLLILVLMKLIMFPEMIKEDFKFSGRNKRPPRDAFNSMISLGYTILMYEIMGEIENRGITPYIGFMHKDIERHPTLASDLWKNGER